MGGVLFHEVFKDVKISEDSDNEINCSTSSTLSIVAISVCAVINAYMQLFTYFD